MIGQYMVVQTCDWLVLGKSANRISFRFRESYISIAIDHPPNPLYLSLLYSCVAAAGTEKKCRVPVQAR